MVGVTQSKAANLSDITIDTNLVMGTHAITINAGGLIDGEDVGELLNEVLILNLANTVVEAITPTGDTPNPEYVNVDDANADQFIAINKYVEFDLLKAYFLDSFRIDANYGDHDGNGTFKITYWDGAAWVEWETGISTVAGTGGGGNFPAWSTSTLINARKFRLIATALDTRGGASDKSYCYCLQLKKT